jgi:hypothetical protein
MKFLMKGQDVNLGQDVFWHSPQPDPNGLRYESTGDLDPSTIEVVKKTSQVEPDLNQETFTAGESISKHDALYYDRSDEKVYKVIEDDLTSYADRLFIGLALEDASNGQSFQVATEGTVPLSVSGAEEGDNLYISSTSSGSLTTDQTSVSVGKSTDRGTSTFLQFDTYTSGSGLQKVSSWTDLPSNPGNGDIVRWDNGGTSSIWRYSSSQDQWILESTFGKDFLLEDWSEGINDDLWTAIRGSTSSPTVNSNNHQIEHSFSSGDSIDDLLMVVPETGIHCEFKAEASLGSGGKPGSGGYLTETGFFDLDKGGGDDRKDIVSNRLVAFSSSYQAEIVQNDGDSGGGFSFQGSSSITVGETYEGKMRMSRPRQHSGPTLFYGETTSGGSTIISNSFSLNQTYSTTTPGVRMSVQQPDISSTLSIGKVWIRKPIKA